MATIENSSNDQQEQQQQEQQQLTILEDSSIETPATNSARRSTMKIINKKPVNAITMAKQARELENQYFAKKKRFVLLKTQLLQKQKTTQDLYQDIIQLREKMILNGAKDPGKLDELKIIEIDNNINNEFVITLNDKLKEITKGYENYCNDLLKKHSIVDNNIEYIINECKKDTDNPNTELIMRIDAYRNDNISLKSQFDEIKTNQLEIINVLMKNIHDFYNEYENSRTRVKELSKTLDEYKDIREKLTIINEELQTEREKHHLTKERRMQNEGQLQRARAKIRDLENKIINDDGKIQQLQMLNKSLENQIKTKEQIMEQRLKDMQKTIKNSEGLVTKMEKQRDSFEARLMELKETMNGKELAAENAMKNMNEQLGAMIVEINLEKEKRQTVEKELTVMKERYKELEVTSQEMCKLLEQNKSFAITDGSHTENELRLFNDLKLAREELEEQRVTIMKLQQEKEEITSVMHQAANNAEDESNDKLIAELMIKSKEIRDVTMKRNHLQQINENLQKRNKALEEQIQDIQNRLQVQMKEGGKTAVNVLVIELQQQISDLRNSLAEATSHTAELETALTQKQLELEQRDRIMREQSKFLKVRDELLSLMKGKNNHVDKDNSNDDEVHHKDIDEINKQIIAKTEAIQELYATLENKQMQVLRLEKIVKQMEDHQDHAQAQRTRLENRIAQLELALQEKSKDHRYVRERSSSSMSKSNATKNDHDKKSFSKLSNNYKGALLRPMMPSNLQRSLTLHSSIKSPSMIRHCNRTTRSSSLIRNNRDIKYNKLFPFSKSDSKTREYIDNDKTYICKRCRHEERGGRFREPVLFLANQNNSNNEIRESLYNWLLDSTELEIVDNLPEEFNSSSLYSDSLSSLEERLQFSNVIDDSHIKRNVNENVNINRTNCNRDDDDDDDDDDDHYHHRSRRFSSKNN
ncbi:PREDICTED: putative leucine-rich repeat-containing protein DDB_G0290503 [Polistes canadensis]|uniref:putative leucine-rich repeat-containing protein DDB_G0290503 n=1 Tax=Polistes canadensis TaxID=91411 RepID=UPI000718E9ED|nr:PREDICTED: putative leucine-rich repeat-containing protein DDB_G0290503 [Polistes canadensis]